MKRILLTFAVAGTVAFAAAQTQQEQKQQPPQPQQPAHQYPQSSSPVAAPPQQAQGPNKAAEYARMNAAEVRFEKTAYNFGKIKEGEKVNCEFKFKNTGKMPLVITNAAGSCGCTIPFFTRDPIEPGKDGSIKVTFDSKGKFAKQDKTVTVTSNAKNSPITLHITGEVTDKDGKPMANPFEEKVKEEKKTDSKEAPKPIPASPVKKDKED